MTYKSNFTCFKMRYDIKSFGLLRFVTVSIFHSYFLVSSFVIVTVLKVINVSYITVSYFFPQALQAKVYFSVSGR